MTVQSIAAGAMMNLSSSSGWLSFSAGEDFARTLNLGQIIKGKVLRQYDGHNRYLVSFDGREKVVDSAVPLTTGELIRGRVVAVGDHVELQRIYGEEGSSGTDVSNDLRAQPERLDQRDQWLQQLLARFQVRMSAEDQATLNRVAAAVRDPASMGLVGVMLNRLGLQQSPELLKSVYGVLRREFASVDLPSLLFGIETLASQIVGAPIAGTRELAQVLSRALSRHDDHDEVRTETPSIGSARPDIALAVQPRVVKPVQDEAKHDDAQQAAWRVLNAQGGGAVAHRVGTLPLLLGDRLVEVSVALFEQQRDAEQPPQAQHRQMVFALSMDRLGSVQIKAQVSGERVRVRVIAQDEERAQQIASYAGELKTMLSSLGWQVDEVVYESQSDVLSAGRDPAVASVIEHVALQDSLNRLI